MRIILKLRILLIIIFLVIYFRLLIKNVIFNGVKINPSK